MKWKKILLKFIWSNDREQEKCFETEKMRGTWKEEERDDFDQKIIHQTNKQNKGKLILWDRYISKLHRNKNEKWERKKRKEILNTILTYCLIYN